MSVVQINSENGRRYQTPDGIFPSVTTILSGTKPEADRLALEQWRNRVGIEEAERISKQSTDDGTLLHFCIEGLNAWDHRMLSYGDALSVIETDDTGADKDRVKMLLGQFRDYIQPRLGQSYFIEEYGWNSNHGYAGAIDHIGEFDGISSVVDWKNSKKAKREDWIKDYRLQGAAYTGMVYRCPVFKDVPPVKQFVCVVFNNETPEPQVFKYSLEDILNREWPLWEQRVKIWHKNNQVTI